MEPPPKVSRHVCGGCVAAAGFLGHGRAADGVEIASERSVRGRERGWRSVQNGVRRVRKWQVVDVQRRPAQKQFVQDGAKRIDVGAAIRRLLARSDLLGAHVPQRSDHLAISRQAGGVRVLRIERRGDTEVDDTGAARAVDEDVPGLEVAVQDVTLVGVVHGVAYAGKELDTLAGVQVLPCGVRAQREGGIDVLHDEVGRSAFA